MHVFKNKLVQIVNRVVVRLVGKHKRNDTKINKIGEMDPGEALGDDGLDA